METVQDWQQNLDDSSKVERISLLKFMTIAIPHEDSTVKVRKQAPTMSHFLWEIIMKSFESHYFDS